VRRAVNRKSELNELRAELTELRAAKAQARRKPNGVAKANFNVAALIV
jgi:ribosomal protein L29